MATEENKAVARRYMGELLSQGKLGVAREIFAEDFVFYSPSGDSTRGVTAFTQFMQELRTAFPDLTFEVEDEVAEGDKVVARFTIHGTHQGSLFGIPATGKSFSVNGVDFLRFARGKIAEIRAVFDTLGQMRQLGLVP